MDRGLDRDRATAWPDRSLTNSSFTGPTIHAWAEEKNEKLDNNEDEEVENQQMDERMWINFLLG